METINPRILVVDDSPIDRRMLSAVLQKEGFAVSTAAEGSEALQRAREEQPELILLDVMMPGESGLETCARLKHDARTAAIPVIFLSASDGVESRVAGLTVGGVDYITKPFQREEVMARIRIHLRIRRAFLALIEQQQAQLRQLKEAQQAILVQPGDIPGARFAVFFNPMHGAGGDFYDVISLGEGISGYFTADIMGHDLKAAFTTSALKALLRQNFNSLYTPAETMMLLNGVLKPLLSDDVILSACCARINRRTGRMVFVSAGHPPIIHLMAGGGIQQLVGEGDLLCAFDTPTFESNEVLVSPGDRLFLFSDGLIEAYLGKTVTRTEGMRYLINAIEKYRGLPLAEMVDTVATAINPHEIPASDDLLLLGVEV